MIKKVQYKFSYDELLKALEQYESEALDQYPHKKKLIQMTVVAMQDFMQSFQAEGLRSDNQAALPGIIQVPQSYELGNSISDVYEDEIQTIKTQQMKDFEVVFYSADNTKRITQVQAPSKASAENQANAECNVLLGEWVTVTEIAQVTRPLPAIQEKLKL